MIIDCHYHLEQRLLPVQTLLRKMDDCEVDKVALMGVINEPTVPMAFTGMTACLITALSKEELKNYFRTKGFKADFWEGILWSVSVYEGAVTFKG